MLSKYLELFSQLFCLQTSSKDLHLSICIQYGSSNHLGPSHDKATGTNCLLRANSTPVSGILIQTVLSAVSAQESLFLGSCVF